MGVDYTLDQIRLKKRFEEFAELLGGEGFPDDHIIDAAIRWICSREPNKQEMLAGVKVLADAWYDADR
jgi:hypothetical protein